MYLVVILVYRIGNSQGVVIENGLGRTYGGRSRRNEEGRLFQIRFGGGEVGHNVFGVLSAN